MKLFYFSGSTIPSQFANSVHVMKMCSAFARQGLDVRLFGKKGKKNTNPYDYYDIDQNFEITRSPYFMLPKIRGVIRILYTLIKAYRYGSPDLFYGRDLTSLTCISIMRIPVILELHELTETRIEKTLLKKIIQFNCLRGIIATTNQLKSDFLKLYDYPESKILVAHNGSDLLTEKPRKISLNTLNKSNFQIGYSGSLYKGKGLELIINLAQKCEDTEFHIFGGHQSQLKIWQEKEIKNVHFYGHKDQSNLKQYLLNCDALIAPYMPTILINTGIDIGRYISPLKLFEYMAYQKPILCSDLPVIREVMSHGTNALLAKPDDFKKWKENIDKLKKEPELQKRLAYNAHKDLVEKYNWDIRAQNILQFLQTLP